MMFLATFFPASTDDDEDLQAGDNKLPFDFFTVCKFITRIKLSLHKDAS